MKKYLSFVAVTMLGFSAGYATELEPTILDACIVSCTSPNGMYGVSDDDLGNLIIVDYAANRLHYYLQEVITLPNGSEYVTNSYSKGMGNCISNDGVVVGNVFESMTDGSYWENGEWKLVEMPQGGTYGIQLNGISSDGRRICGVVSSDGSDMAGKPGVWTRDEAGKYTDFKWLPFPEGDFTGRLPQNITAVSISGDGKVIAGQIWDYYGAVHEPIIYVEDEEGNWTYKLIEPAFYGHEWSENPGEPPVQPEAENYMTPIEWAAYQKAVESYTGEYTLPLPNAQDYMTEEEWAAYMEEYEKWDVTLTPFPPAVSNFMTEEEYAAYQAAMDAYYNSIMPYPTPEQFMSESEYKTYAEDVQNYNEVFMQWYDKQIVFQTEYFDFIANLPTFDPNNVILSENGRYYASTSVMDYMGTAYRYDLQEGTSKSYTGDVLATYVNGDGILMAGAPLYAFTRTAKILDGTDGDFIDASTYIEEKNPEMGSWVNDLCPGLGTPSGAQDLSILWGWANIETYESYIIPMVAIDGAKAVGADNLGIKLGSNGTICIEGEASGLAIYGIGGEKMMDVKNPGSRVATDLASGIYIVKITGLNGKQIIRKIAL